MRRLNAGAAVLFDKVSKCLQLCFRIHDRAVDVHHHVAGFFFDDMDVCVVCLSDKEVRCFNDFSLVRQVFRINVQIHFFYINVP